MVVFAATAFGFTSLSIMPMAEVSAIGYVAPLMVTIMSFLILKEKVGPRRLLAVGIGFVGVIAILRPDQANFSLWSLLPLAMATCYATFMVMTRLIVARPRRSIPCSTRPLSVPSWRPFRCPSSGRTRSRCTG